MPHWEILWVDGAGGNVEHIAAHGITQEEVECVLRNPIEETTSRTTGRLLAIGYTDARRRITVIYEHIDLVTIYPVTAFESEL